MHSYSKLQRLRKLKVVCRVLVRKPRYAAQVFQEENCVVSRARQDFLRQSREQLAERYRLTKFCSSRDSFKAFVSNHFNALRLSTTIGTTGVPVLADSNAVRAVD